MNRITECKSVLSLIVVLLCFILQSNAQGVLSLEDCRRLAIENNKKLKIADEDVKASEAQKAEAFTKYLPSIDAMGVYLRNQKEINLLSDDAHLPVGSIGSDGKFTFRPDQSAQQQLAADHRDDGVQPADDEKDQHAHHDIALGDHVAKGGDDRGRTKLRNCAGRADPADLHGREDQGL